MAVRRVAPRDAAHRLPAASGGTAPAPGWAVAHRGDRGAKGRRPDARRDRRSRYHLRPGHGRARHRARRVHECPEARAPDARPARPQPRLRHAEQPGAARVRGPGGGGPAPGRSYARAGPAGQARQRVAAAGLVQRFRRCDAGRAQPHQLSRPLQPRPVHRVGRHRQRCQPALRLLRPLVEPDPSSHAPHRDGRRGVGRGRSSGRRALVGPRSARAPGLRRRSPPRLRRPLDGHDEPRLSRPPPVGGRRDDRSGPLGLHHGATGLAARGGLVYSNPGPGYASSSRYDVEGFGRFTGEASVRAPFPLGTTLGVRLFGGAYAGRSVPVPQRRIPIAGADPYETFTNPLLRSAGALFVRPDFYYHAPGNGNLRGFRNDLGGRWAVTVNLELARSVWRRDRGILRDVSLTGFVDGGLVDTLAVAPTSPGRRYTPLYDGGVGLVTRHQIRDLGWTMRVELPLVVSRWNYARDPRPSEGRLAFRWQLSLSPSF